MPIPVLKVLKLSVTNIVHAENEQDLYFPNSGRQNNSSHFNLYFISGLAAAALLLLGSTWLGHQLLGNQMTGNYQSVTSHWTVLYSLINYSAAPAPYIIPTSLCA